MLKKKAVFLAVIFGVFLLLPLMAHARKATPIDSGWIKSNAFTANIAAILNGVASNGAGTYVAVGNQGIALKSTDGTNWSLEVQISVNQKNLLGVTYGSTGSFTGFIAVGDLRTVSRQNAGETTWNTTQPSGIVGNLKAVTFGNGLFVAVGDNGGVFTYNGNAGNIWVRQALTISGTALTTAVLNAVTWIPSEACFMAVGAGGVVLKSFDGFYWEKDTITSGGTLQGIAFGGGLYVAINSAATLFASTDGFTQWTPFKSSFTGITSGNLRGITYDSVSGNFIVAGNKGGIWRPDPIFGWVAATVPTRPALINPLPIITNIRAVGNDGTRFYAVGESGLILTTTDLDQWFYNSTSNPTARLTGAAFGNGVFVTAGQYGNIFTSATGLNWSESRLTKIEDNTLPFIESVTFGSGLFVAVGDADSLDTGTPVPAIFTSPDGLKWTQRSEFTQDFATGVANMDLFGAAAGTYGGNPLYVAVGTAGTIITSPDGIAWTNHSITTQNLNAVAFGGVNFVAVGDKGVIWYSPNGTSWTAASLGITNPPHFQSVAYGNGTFVAVASNGSAYYTTNPAGTWTKASFVTANSGALYGVTYVSTGTFAGFVAVGAAGAVWASSDGSGTSGSSWAKVTTGAVNSSTLEAVAFGNNTIVAAGGASTIITKTLP